jgi:hypothetical protein
MSAPTQAVAQVERSFMKITTAAKIGDMHPDTLLRAINAGRGPKVCRLPSGSIRISVDDFYAWLRGETQESA